jgi:hypothetical protein
LKKKFQKILLLFLELLFVNLNHGLRYYIYDCKFIGGNLVGFALISNTFLEILRNYSFGSLSTMATYAKY